VAVLAEGELELRLSKSSVDAIQKDIASTSRTAGAKAGTEIGDASAKTFSKAFAGGLTGVAAFSAIRQGFQFIQSSVAEFAQSARGIAQTNAVLRSTGQVAGVSAKDVDRLADRLGNLAAVDNDVVRGAENVLLTFTNLRNSVGRGNDIFNQSTEAVLDLSAAMGGDLQGAAIQIGKALNDPIRGVTALTRVGVVFTEQQRGQIQTLAESGRVMEAQKIILKELNTEFGGVAAALADADGGIQRASVAFNEMKEAIGAGLAPAIVRTTPLVTGLSHAIADLPAEVTGAGLAFFGLTAGAAILIRLRALVQSTTASLVAMGGAGKFAGTGLVGLGKVGGVAVGLGLAASGVSALGGALDELVRGAPKLDELSGRLVDLASDAKNLDEVLAAGRTGNSFVERLTRELKNTSLTGSLRDLFIPPFLREDEDRLRRLSDRYNDIDQALAGLVERGAAKAAAADVKILAAELDLTPKDLDAVFNDYTNALQANATQAKLSKLAQAELANGIGSLETAVSSAQTGIAAVNDAFAQSLLFSGSGARFGEAATGAAIALSTTLDDSGNAVVDFSQALGRLSPSAAAAANAMSRLASGIDPLTARFDLAAATADQFSNALSFSLGAYISVREATIGVAQAEEALSVRSTAAAKDLYAVERAALAVESANFRLADSFKAQARAALEVTDANLGIAEARLALQKATRFGSGLERERATVALARAENRLTDTLESQVRTAHDIRDAQLAVLDASKKTTEERGVATRSIADQQGATLRLVQAVQAEVDARVRASEGNITAQQARDLLLQGIDREIQKYPRLKRELLLYRAEIEATPNEKLIDFRPPDFKPATEDLKGLNTVLRELVRLLANKFKLDLNTDDAKKRADDLLLTLALLGENAFSPEELAKVRAYEANRGAGREHGGPVLAGHPYVVGERRAEVFVPDRNGTIHPDAAAFERAGNRSAQRTWNGDINVYEVTGDPEATAFAVMSRLAAAMNL